MSGWRAQGPTGILVLAVELLLDDGAVAAADFPVGLPVIFPNDRRRDGGVRELGRILGNPGMRRAGVAVKGIGPDGYSGLGSRVTA